MATIHRVIARISRLSQDAWDYSPLALEGAARDLWRSIHGHRRFRSEASLIIAVDLVPWTIHEIQDDETYQTALEAFNRERI